jgi:hypothetical protein
MAGKENRAYKKRQRYNKSVAETRENNGETRREHKKKETEKLKISHWNSLEYDWKTEEREWDIK